MLYTVTVELVLTLWLNIGRQSTHSDINAQPRRSFEAPIAAATAYSLTPWRIRRA
jgi:hypothetical protein